MANDLETSLRISREAHQMAVRVNKGEPGILASRDAPGCAMATRCAAKAGSPPLWGQKGRFTIDVDGMRVRIETDGIFGLFTREEIARDFAAHAVDFDRPFISKTGYRSFLGFPGVQPEPGQTPEEWYRQAIRTFVSRDLKGKLVTIKEGHRT